MDHRGKHQKNGIYIKPYVPYKNCDFDIDIDFGENECI